MSYHKIHIRKQNSLENFVIVTQKTHTCILKELRQDQQELLFASVIFVFRISNNWFHIDTARSEILKYIPCYIYCHSIRPKYKFSNTESFNCINILPDWSISFLMKFLIGAPGWLSWLSIRLRLGHDLIVHGFEPHIRLGVLSHFLSLYPSPTCAFSLCLKIDKLF